MPIDGPFLGVEAATIGPSSQARDRLGGRGGHGDNVVGSLHQRYIQQCRQSAAALDFGARELGVIWTTLLGVKVVVLEILLPNQVALLPAGKIQKEDRIKAFGTCQLWRKPADVVGRAYDKNLTFMVV